KFFPYVDEKRNPFLNGSEGSFFTSSDAESGLASVPYRWESWAGIHYMRFVAGFIGIAQNRTTKALRPEIGWAIYEDRTLDLKQLERLFDDHEAHQAPQPKD
ncbi:MAG: hypothetical protein ABI700_31425, partial [Chloroflexota bacterium]